MSAPWFDANTFAWLPGTAFGVLGGLWGSLAGVLGGQGKGKTLVYSTGLLLAAAGVAIFAGGVVALADGQPYGVWYGLLLPGTMALVALAWVPRLVRNGYRQAETRRMEAKDAPL